MMWWFIAQGRQQPSQQLHIETSKFVSAKIIQTFDVVWLKRRRIWLSEKSSRFSFTSATLFLFPLLNSFRLYLYTIWLFLMCWSGSVRMPIELNLLVEEDARRRRGGRFTRFIVCPMTPEKLHARKSSLIVFPPSQQQQRNGASHRLKWVVNFRTTANSPCTSVCFFFGSQEDDSFVINKQMMGAVGR